MNAKTSDDQHRETVEVLLDHGGAGHRATGRPAEHVRETAATPRVQQHEQDERRGNEEMYDDEQRVDHATKILPPAGTRP